MVDGREDGLARRLRCAAGFPGAVWDEYQLRKDPVYGRLGVDDRRRIPLAAAEAAVAVRDRLNAEFGILKPPGYAAELNISISRERPSHMGRTPFLSLATREPPAIIVSPEALELAEGELARRDVTLPGGTRIDWEEVAIGHELFHHLEWREPSLEKPLGRVTTRKLGPFRMRGRPVSAEEIAAMHFSQHLTGCAIRPDLLEILFLLGVDPETACFWLAELETLAGW